MGYGGTGTCLAMAHMHPASSRVMATTTWLACLPRAMHPAQGLQRLDHRVQAPRCDVLLELLFPTLQACRVFGDRPDVVLEDHLLRRGGTDDFAEPPEVGRAPGRLARIAEIVPEQKGFETELRRLEVANGVFTSPTQITDGFIFHGGDVDGSEISRTHEAGQLDSIAAVCFHPIPRLFGDQRGGHDPAAVSFVAQIPVEPVAAGASFVDKNQVFGLRVQLPAELIDVGMSGANGAAVNDLRVMIARDVGDRNRVFMDIQSDVERGRLWPG
jgi:hypothetical protein